MRSAAGGLGQVADGAGVERAGVALQVDELDRVVAAGGWGRWRACCRGRPRSTRRRGPWNGGRAPGSGHGRAVWQRVAARLVQPGVGVLRHLAQCCRGSLMQVIAELLTTSHPAGIGSAGRDGSCSSRRCVSGHRLPACLSCMALRQAGDARRRPAAPRALELWHSAHSTGRRFISAPGGPAGNRSWFSLSCRVRMLVSTLPVAMSSTLAVAVAVVAVHLGRDRRHDLVAGQLGLPDSCL